MNLDKKQFIDLLTQIAPNRYLQALVIIFLFLAVAKIIDLIFTRVVSKWIVKTQLKLDDHVFEIFHRPVFLTIILFGLALATERLELKSFIYLVTVNGLKTIGIFYWAMALTRFFKLLLNVFSNDESRFKFIQDHTLPLFNNLLVLIVTGFSAYIIFLVWDIDLTAWVASAGILGLAVSFAAKDTLANLFSGVFIMADAPYKLGDFIVLDSGERGEVRSIGIRSTRLLTRDDVEITVPNSIMGNTKIINEAGGRHEKYRIRVKVGVAYGSDIDKVHAVLLDVANNHPDVCKSPAPRVRFRAFGDSSLDHELLCWVEKPVLQGKILHMLNTQVYKSFIKEQIEIPFPQRDIHVKSFIENK
ncbi:MAG: mechanosensitive ion channel family protein [Proteobacteria bacterium]|nr:mechanosensitive ion channel family protein [Pseudomonadota bacterium]MBU1389583.1 mechanosensitive ion channel family protein [Pseudomonadota bacterium]MBU1544447.1 mechanosensitive ion channel family protein [Pseudomonadota bacterium]MBU2429128.1 mechanosensitive ion channel family protein [Pseudomonadota bacterium]MBU2479454.1 mechanosensitive ion channel family protein [Pseudomonadota bacterium]